ncbi:exodeoxyribonuclease V subunit alpha [Lysobacter sp. Root494]|uniref:exodeoxyribonuclease V subunit alpha n=1 Tax=Lysobacter sp. Root494 TaxID=1736549 RepID=UPI00070188FC|nr:exodeoxyribonuclease V subunit alpha [Lysobacter sp. Root494]KQY54670.1 exodeoxyribonuclease V subunit alpha [Lysobacter sp. Root494]
MSRQLSLHADAGGRAVDRALVDVLRRLDPATDPRVLQAAELASLAISLGHAALDLQRPQLLVESFDELPQPQPWREALQASRWVATPAPHEAAPGDVPLVLEGDLLYLRRYREYERRLVAGLRRLAAHAPAAEDLATLAPLFAALFPHARDDDAQARAAALALRRSLLLVTGGPGTGKTTTIARLLVLLVAQARNAGRDTPRIALAAPTGRAADRMAASLHRSLATLREHPDIDPVLFDALPIDARTLHRLLGTVPGSTRFRHDASQPLAFDAVVVDEASMVDLPLMCKLVEAVRDGARLILLGDADQLPSVEAGDVLAAIVEASGDGLALPVDAVQSLQPLLGTMASIESSTTSPLQGHRIHLRRGYRQSAALDLAPLADAARQGHADEALALLRGQQLSGVHFHADHFDLLSAATREELLAPWRELATLADPRAALAIADRARVLTALREGQQGASQLNARIEEALAGAQRDAYFHGRLLLVTENSYRHGLFNGDIGVCLRDDSGTIVAWFNGAADVRGFHAAALPAHGGAFAMTVHKSQGSEYDTVWLQLPKQEARTLSRELVYTALTRARECVHICASEAVLRGALSRHAQRVSGLAQRLRT